MGTIKQSVCLPMFDSTHITLDELLPTVADIGYQAVEIWSREQNFDQLLALCAANGLVMASMVGHGSLESGLNDPAQHERIEAELRESIDIAAQHGIPGVICFSGSRREGVSEEAALEATVNGLRRIALYAEKKGVNLNLELLNSTLDHPNYQCDRTAWGVAVCSQVNSPRVKLLYDIYHMQIMEGNIISTIRENIDWIGHFHTAGVPGRQDLDDSQELNYKAICRAISDTDYSLYIGHEFRQKGELVPALKRAFKTCRVTPEI